MSMNLPNKLTIFRVILIPVFIIALMSGIIPEPVNRYVGVVIFCVASFTDYLDGHIARKYNLVTNFGKFMDPLADKLLVSSALICMIELGSCVDCNYNHKPRIYYNGIQTYCRGRRTRNSGKLVGKNKNGYADAYDNISTAWSRRNYRKYSYNTRNCIYGNFGR